MKKPVIAVDVDHVCFDYLKGFFHWHNRKYRTNWRVRDIRVYDITQTLNIPPAELQAEFDEFNVGHLLSLPVVSGARAGIRRLAEREYELISVSDRPTVLYEGTKSSLVQAFGDVFLGVYLTGRTVGPISEGEMSKGTVCKERRARHMVEDGLECALEIKRKSPDTHVWLFGNYGWNRTNEEHDGITPAGTWKDVVEGILEIDGVSP